MRLKENMIDSLAQYMGGGKIDKTEQLTLFPFTDINVKTRRAVYCPKEKKMRPSNRLVQFLVSIPLLPILFIPKSKPYGALTISSP
jgi:hypothetical protein